MATKQEFIEDMKEIIMFGESLRHLNEEMWSMPISEGQFGIL